MPRYFECIGIMAPTVCPFEHLYFDLGLATLLNPSRCECSKSLPHVRAIQVTSKKTESI